MDSLDITKIARLMHAFCVRKIRISTWDIVMLKHFEEWLREYARHIILMLRQGLDEWEDLKYILELGENADKWEFLGESEHMQALMDWLGKKGTKVKALRINSERYSRRDDSFLWEIPRQWAGQLKMLDIALSHPHAVHFVTIAHLEMLSCRPSQFALFSGGPIVTILRQITQLRLTIKSECDLEVLYTGTPCVSIIELCNSLTSLSYLHTFGINDFRHMKRYKKSLQSVQMNLTFFAQNLGGWECSVFPRVHTLTDYQPQGVLSRNTARLLVNLMYVFPKTEQSDVVLSSPEGSRYGYCQEAELNMEWHDILAYARGTFGDEMEALLVHQRDIVLQVFQEHFFVSVEKKRKSPEQIFDELRKQGAHLLVAKYCMFRAQYVEPPPIVRSRWDFTY